MFGGVHQRGELLAAPRDLGFAGAPLFVALALLVGLARLFEFARRFQLGALARLLLLAAPFGVLGISARCNRRPATVRDLGKA